MASYQPPSGVFWGPPDLARTHGLPILTINLTPQLTGVIGTLNLVYTGIYYPLIDLPPSDFGLISVTVSVGSPESEYAVTFLETEIDGVRYQATETPLFNRVTAVTIVLTLEPVTPPEPPPEPPTPRPTIPYAEIIVPVGVGIGLTWLLSR